MRPSAPTVTQRLAAIRLLFDWLVTGQVVAHNPAASVRGPSHHVRAGRTPVLEAVEAWQLLESIDVSTHAGLRGSAPIALTVFSFVRIGAALAMRVENVYPAATPMSAPARERRQDAGGAMPCHYTLEAYLDGTGIA